MIEVIAMNVEDAVAIEASGGDRIELVSAMDRDGLTPSLVLLEQVVKAVNIPVNVMVRCDDTFHFTEVQIEAMLKDILRLKSMNVNGIVWGSLLNGRVDLQLLKRVRMIWEKEITFHRAIDRSSDMVKDYKVLLPMVTSILTSGGLGKAIVERDEYTTRRRPRPLERRSELQGVCRPERMQPQDSQGLSANRVTRQHLVPAPPEAVEDPERRGLVRRIEVDSTQ